MTIDEVSEFIVMKDKIKEDLQIERKIVMEHNIYGRCWEKALRKYDELAIRYDQMMKVFELIDKLEIMNKTNNVTD